MADTNVGVTVEVKIIAHIVGDDSSVTQKVIKEYRTTLAEGTGANQSGTQWWSPARSLASTSEDLNVDGELDFQGVATGLNNLKVLMVHNTSSTASNNLAVGGASGNQLVNWVADGSDIVNVGPEGLLLLVSPVDGYAVTASTGDLLKVNSPSATVAYDILMVGDH